MYRHPKTATSPCSLRLAPGSNSLAGVLYYSIVWLTCTLPEIVAVKNATLSLVLPIRNASAVLATAVQDCVLTVPHYFADYEIIIVDDNSSDDTPAIAHQLAVAHDSVMIISHEQALGYAHALWSGLRHARGDYILSLPVDAGIGISELVRMLPYLDHYELVMGYRLQHSHLWQRPVSAVLVQFVINKLLRLDLRDIGCRFSLLRADMLHRMELGPSEILHAQIYALARHQQVDCVQVALHHQSHAPGERNEEMSMSSLWATMRLWWNLRHAPAPDRALPEPPIQPAHSLRQHQQKLVVGVGVVAAASSVWLLLRRRVI